MFRTILFSIKIAFLVLLSSTTTMAQHGRSEIQENPAIFPSLGVKVQLDSGWMAKYSSSGYISVYYLQYEDEWSSSTMSVHLYPNSNTDSLGAIEIWKLNTSDDEYTKNDYLIQDSSFHSNELDYYYHIRYTANNYCIRNADSSIVVVSGVVCSPSQYIFFREYRSGPVLIDDQIYLCLTTLKGITFYKDLRYKNVQEQRTFFFKKFEESLTHPDSIASILITEPILTNLFGASSSDADSLKAKIDSWNSSVFTFLSEINANDTVVFQTKKLIYDSKNSFGKNQLYKGEAQVLTNSVLFARLRFFCFFYNDRFYLGKLEYELIN